MNISHELNQLCKVCINHFEELCEDGTGKIKVFSIELDSQTIWGGNGDRDTETAYYLTTNGWLERKTITEYGLYGKGDGVVEDNSQATTSENIEQILNGMKATIYDVKQLFRFYEQVRDRYPLEFK